MRIFILSFIFFATGNLYAQQNGLDKINEFDLSSIWTSNGSTDISDGNLFTTERPDLKGFIGDNFQRIDIRIDEVVKNELNPLMYYVHGFSEVKGNRCSFIGRITIDSAKLKEREPIIEGADYLVDMTMVARRGTVFCTYQFFENRNQKWTGFFSGQLQTYVYITTEQQIKYDAIGGFSDSYMNNMYVGKWASYASGNSKRCNWGEFRIPESGDLDIGAGEFSPNPKYIENGWQVK
jgi:hypothetical protein